jgi:ribose 5-phosphate isomerase B
MKRYEIITEADARHIEVGSSVALVAGGHITPLAQDTLRARRVSVQRDGGVDPDMAALAPAADIRQLVIGSDHAGVALKRALRDHLRSMGLAVDDVGTDGAEAVDYPDIAAAVARPVARGEVQAGIVIDGAGLGSAIAANKIDGVRAAMCTNTTLARYAREHNGANVLALGATLLTVDEAIAVTRTWIATPMREARYIRRLVKIRTLERTR